MGCFICSVTVDETQPSEPNATNCRVPFGHVPYTPALPGTMGPLWDFPLEWWYYGGWASDLTGSKQFTLMMCTTRQPQNQSSSAGSILYGIGSVGIGLARYKFTSSSAQGYGKFPSPTSTSWATALQTTSPTQSTMTCKLISGILGLSGAKYQLDMADTTNHATVSLVLKDTFGILILEVGSGAYHQKGGGDSYEFAMPSRKGAA